MVNRHLGAREISERGTVNNGAAEMKELLRPRVNPLKTKADNGGTRGRGRCEDTRSESETPPHMAQWSVVASTVGRWAGVVLCQAGPREEFSPRSRFPQFFHFPVLLSLPFCFIFKPKFKFHTYLKVQTKSLNEIDEIQFF
jgi:hypothetical protein